jgi:hypothetical protein
MTLSFTQACSGDVVKIGLDSFFISQKCIAEHYVVLMPLGSSNSKRVYELEFNQSKPVLVSEGMELKSK